jgi:hypothetical protein
VLVISYPGQIVKASPIDMDLIYSPEQYIKSDAKSLTQLRFSPLLGGGNQDFNAKTLSASNRMHEVKTIEHIIAECCNMKIVTPASMMKKELEEHNFQGAWRCRSHDTFDPTLHFFSLPLENVKDCWSAFVNWINNEIDQGRSAFVPQFGTIGCRTYNLGIKIPQFVVARSFADRHGLSHNSAQTKVRGKSNNRQIQMCINDNKDHEPFSVFCCSHL